MNDREIFETNLPAVRARVAAFKRAMASIGAPVTLADEMGALGAAWQAVLADPAARARVGNYLHGGEAA